MKHHFVHCTCDTYTHYRWCIHAYGEAELQGLISSWPKNLNPAQIRQGKKQFGHPLKGGVFGHQ